MKMNIAVATDENHMPAEHFGRAGQYEVFAVQDGRIVRREERAKPVCCHGAGHADEDEEDGPDLHTRMSDVIADCQVVLAGGIPAPMMRHLASVGLRPQTTNAPSAEQAVQDYVRLHPAG